MDGLQAQKESDLPKDLLPSTLQATQEHFAADLNETSAKGNRGRGPKFKGFQRHWYFVIAARDFLTFLKAYLT